MLLASELSKDSGVPISLPVVGCAPEWMSGEGRVHNQVVATGTTPSWALTLCMGLQR